MDCLKRPSVARMSVEMDVAKPPIQCLWARDKSQGQWQKVEYENWPSFYLFCEHIGHSEEKCFKKNPSHKPARSTVVVVKKQV